MSAFEYFESARGFSFVIMDESGSGPPWGRILPDDLAIVQIELPAKGKIRLIKDGELFREEVGMELTCGIDGTGIYRVEVYLWRAFQIPALDLLESDLRPLNKSIQSIQSFPVCPVPIPSHDLRWNNLF